MERNLDFDAWFDIFHKKCKSLGYNGPIDKYSFDLEHQEGQTPEFAAEEFVKEMND